MGQPVRGRLILSSQADGRNRTGDPFITSEVLYQLSYVGAGGLYGPIKSAVLEPVRRADFSGG